LECDDDDGATYTSLGGTSIAWGLNSVIAGHPLATASDVVSVNGFRCRGETGTPIGLYRHVVPAANLVIPASDPGNTPATAFPVPMSPTPWMIGETSLPAMLTGTSSMPTLVRPSSWLWI
jgi:hypothetical protein